MVQAILTRGHIRSSVGVKQDVPILQVLRLWSLLEVLLQRVATLRVSACRGDWSGVNCVCRHIGAALLRIEVSRQSSSVAILKFRIFGQ